MDNGYIKGLDGIRAIAILLVMTFHAELTHFGWMGVQLFFVLSGYLIIGILWKDKFKPDSLSYKFKKFWVRRSLRIFPLYFGYLFAISLIYLIFKVPSSFPTYFPYLLTYTFNYSLYLPDTQGPFFTFLWSLCIEEQFYLLFPLIIFFCPPRFIKWLMVVVIVAAPLIRLLLGEYYKIRGMSPDLVANSVYWNTVSHFDAFFLGGIIPVFSLDKKINKPHWLLIGSLVTVLVAGGWNFLNSESGKYYFNDLGYNHGSIYNYEHVWHYTLLNIFFSAIILTLVSRHSAGKFMGMKKFLEHKWMISIGKVSYGMYMFHWGILVYVYAPLFPAKTIVMKLLLFAPYVLVVYLCAQVSYHLYEARFIKLKDVFFGSKKAVVKSNEVLSAGKLKESRL
jgi:peptidoglycan/LPS O-acetylase OafA/YrhL